MSLLVFNPIFMSFVAISSCLAYIAVPRPPLQRSSYSNVELWEKTSVVLLVIIYTYTGVGVPL